MSDNKNYFHDDCGMFDVTVNGLTVQKTHVEYTLCLEEEGFPEMALVNGAFVEQNGVLVTEVNLYDLVSQDEQYCLEQAIAEKEQQAWYETPLDPMALRLLQAKVRAAS